MDDDGGDEPGDVEARGEAVGGVARLVHGAALGQRNRTCKGAEGNRVQTRGRHFPPALLYARPSPLQHPGSSCRRPILSTTTSSARRGASPASMATTAPRQRSEESRGGKEGART